MKVLMLIIMCFTLCGCELSLDSTKERDEAIEECKRSGGIPYVENYDDSRLRPIVHCRFGELKESDNK